MPIPLNVLKYIGLFKKFGAKMIQKFATAPDCLTVHGSYLRLKRRLLLIVSAYTVFTLYCTLLPVLAPGGGGPGEWKIPRYLYLVPVQYEYYVPRNVPRTFSGLLSLYRYEPLSRTTLYSTTSY